MKVTVCLFALFAIALARPDSSYTDKYDYINVQEVVSNPRVLESYINCILDLGKCTAEAKELKSHIQEALENECAKCTEPQKKGTRVVMSHLVNHEPEYWSKLTAKFDPERKYVEKYEKELKTLTTN